MSGMPFNTGDWTDEENEGLARGLEAYGYGSWDAVRITFVPTRSPIQIQAHARQHFPEGIPTGRSPQEVTLHSLGTASSSSSTTSISQLSLSSGAGASGDDDESRAGTGDGGDDGGGDGGSEGRLHSELRDPSPVARSVHHLVAPEEDGDSDRDSDTDSTGGNPVACFVSISGMLPVVPQDLEQQQQRQRQLPARRVWSWADTTPAGLAPRSNSVNANELLFLAAHDVLGIL